MDNIVGKPCAVAPRSPQEGRAVLSHRLAREELSPLPLHPSHVTSEAVEQSGVLAAPLALVVNRKPRHGSETRKRQKFARFRVTDDELAQISIAADRADLDVSTFLRVQCLGAPVPRKARAPSIDRELLGYVAAQLGKIGSNLNQIARVLNSGGDEPDDIMLAIADVREAMAEIKRAAGKKPS